MTPPEESQLAGLGKTEDDIITDWLTDERRGAVRGGVYDVMG